MKKCPFCAEDIQDAAIVCKHCGRDLPSKEGESQQEDAFLESLGRSFNPSQSQLRTQMRWGRISPTVVCSHCHTKGEVRTLRVTRKKGIGGGKTTAAILTGGISLFATGLSRKEALTQAHCGKCGSTWDF
jgi:hypothetical protein